MAVIFDLYPTTEDASNVLSEVSRLITDTSETELKLCVVFVDETNSHLAQKIKDAFQQQLATERILVIQSGSKDTPVLKRTLDLKYLLDTRRISNFTVFTVQEDMLLQLSALDIIFTSVYNIKLKVYGGEYIDIQAALATVADSVKASTEDELGQLLPSIHTVPGENVEVIRSDIICNKTFYHGFSTRKGGCSFYPPVASLNVLFRPEKRDSPLVVTENRRRLMQAVGASSNDKLIFPKVGHTNVVWITGDPEPAEYDAFVTDKPGLALAAPSADCVTIIMAVAEKSVCAATHSGRKGIVGNIANATVQAMTERFGCQLPDIKAVIGPSIGICCYEVGKDVEDTFSNDPLLKDCISAMKGKAKKHLDLQMAVKLQLQEAGLLPVNIDDGLSKLCTRCNSDSFYSARRDGSPFGTLVGVIGLR